MEINSKTPKASLAGFYLQVWSVSPQALTLVEASISTAHFHIRFSAPLEEIDIESLQERRFLPFQSSTPLPG